MVVDYQKDLRSRRTRCGADAGTNWTVLQSHTLEIGDKLLQIRLIDSQTGDNLLDWSQIKSPRSAGNVEDANAICRAIGDKLRQLIAAHDVCLVADGLRRDGQVSDCGMRLHPIDREHAVQVYDSGKLSGFCRGGENPNDFRPKQRLLLTGWKRNGQVMDLNLHVNDHSAHIKHIS